MAIDPTLRLSDAERDSVVARLSDGLSDGRLELDDFNERLDAAYSAKTHGEVAVLTSDLPKVKRPKTPATRRARLKRRFGSYLAVNAVLWSIWTTQVLTAGSPHDLWPLWVTIPWGAWLLF